MCFFVVFFVSVRERVCVCVRERESVYVCMLVFSARVTHS